jgi:predicted RNase H-like HicB family nuclease
VTAVPIAVEVRFPIRVVTYPAPDMPNTWLGHSLDLDIMAQGNSPEQAVAALMEVLSETIAFRLTQGLPPIKWMPAPDEVWKGAESSAGEALDRNPPALKFEAPGAPQTETQSTLVFRMDRVPEPIAHAG